MNEELKVMAKCDIDMDILIEILEVFIHQSNLSKNTLKKLISLHRYLVKEYDRKIYSNMPNDIDEQKHFYATKKNGEEKTIEIDDKCYEDKKLKYIVNNYLLEKKQHSDNIQKIIKNLSEELSKNERKLNSKLGTNDSIFNYYLKETTFYK